MKRFLTLALVGVAALGLGSTAYANICATDVVPAATLLFPFVQYDYEAGDVGNDGDTTLFAITNVSSEAAIVHITVWTDFSVAILDFNLTLTGYDVQTINIRDILRDGVLPNEDNGANIWETNNWDLQPAPVPFDDGPYSSFNESWGGSLDGYFALNGLPVTQATAPALDCDPAVWESSPNNYAAFGNIPGATLDIFEGYLKRSQDATKGYLDCAGDPVSFENDPWFLTRSSGPVWMYVTADVVGACNKDLPDGSGVNYFNQSATTGVQFDNVLIGDILYLNSGDNYSEADNAVHVEAIATSGFGPAINAEVGKGASFYLRYHNGAGPTYYDGREPLPTAWAFRYIVAPSAGAKTWIRAWKGSMAQSRIVDLYSSDLAAPITGPNPAELWSDSCIPYTYYAWDEDENVNSVGPGLVPPWSGGPIVEPIPVPNLLPLETQEVDAEEFFLVGDPSEGAFGWMLFIWPLSNWDSTNPADIDYDQYQTWMGVKYAAFGQYTAGLSGAVMANYNCNPSQTLPLLGLQTGMIMIPVK